MATDELGTVTVVEEDFVVISETENNVTVKTVVSYVVCRSQSSADVEAI